MASKLEAVLEMASRWPRNDIKKMVLETALETALEAAPKTDLKLEMDGLVELREQTPSVFDSPRVGLGFRRAPHTMKYPENTHKIPIKYR